MKIATWNIGEDIRNEDNHLTIDSYNSICDFINKYEIDIICLQEAITSSNDLPNMSEYIKNNTSLKYNISLETEKSHINIGNMMGVVICSKFPIDEVNKFMFKNPNWPLIKDSSSFSHDKGFIFCCIKGIKIISCHCIPFKAFGKDPLNHLDIFSELDNKLIDTYKENNKMILCGDMNYDNVVNYFPKYFEIADDYIKDATRKDKRLDHMIVTKEIKVNYVDIIETYSDHRLCIIGINN